MNVVVDCLGRPCPVPVIELARAVQQVPVGGTVEVLADDPAAGPDIAAWCRLRGQRLVLAEPRERGRSYLVERSR